LSPAHLKKSINRLIDELEQEDQVGEDSQQKKQHSMCIYTESQKFVAAA
jgi:hypothetical protein